MGKATGRARIERNLVDMSADGDSDGDEAVIDVREHVEDEVLEVRSTETTTDITWEDRVIIRIDEDSLQRMVSFAFVQQARSELGWFNVRRVDSNHGTVHEHIFRSDGEEVGQPTVLWTIDKQEQVSMLYHEATTHVFETWEEQRDRWDRD